jgi:hypothetical protein
MKRMLPMASLRRVSAFPCRGRWGIYGKGGRGGTGIHGAVEEEHHAAEEEEASAGAAGHSYFCDVVSMIWTFGEIASVLCMSVNHIDGIFAVFATGVREGGDRLIEMRNAIRAEMRMEGCAEET